MNHTYRYVLFDLDGTLLDTAHDLLRALNTLLALHNRQSLTLDAVRVAAAKGARGLIKLGFDLEPHAADYPALAKACITQYQQVISDETKPFPGILTVLDYLECATIPWGIVTNKPAALTLPLIEAMAFDYPPHCIISGDTTLPKPAPDPLLLACRELQCAPADCLYVGDAEMDVLAAQAARMPVLVAQYGYLGPNDNPKAWGANGYIQHPLEIIAWLQGG